MIIRVFLYPASLLIAGVKIGSPDIFRFLEEHGAEFEVENWDGTLSLIPDGPPALIRASTRMRCSRKELALACAARGHLAFYENAIVEEESSELCRLSDSLTRFLERVRASMLTPDQFVEFLYAGAGSIHESLYGRATLVRRQASLLFSLWNQHVLVNLPVVAIRPEDQYPVVWPDTEKSLGSLAHDMKMVQELKAALEADHWFLSDMEDVGSYAHVRYYAKLRLGLERNLAVLRNYASDYMHTLEKIEQCRAASLPESTELTSEMIKVRAALNCTGDAVRLLYDQMLPILMRTLVKLGYPPAPDREVKKKEEEK